MDIEKIKSKLEDISKKREECEREGHKKPTWINYTPTTISDTKVYGRCKYCLADLERSLTPEEYEKLIEFRERVREPMTI